MNLEMNNMIEIKRFTKAFKDRVLFKDFSLSLPKSGVVALVGQSGCGKTTLLNSIAGLDFDYDGEITIDDINLKGLNEDELMDYRIHNIGYIFQNFNLLNLDDVKTNILLPFESTSNASDLIKERKVDELVKLLGISKLLKQNVNKLSGGEKQRVAIARAMCNSPKVILCDEPTGALDELNGEQIFNILKDISSKSLIIIATHDLEGVKKIADKIVYLNEEEIKVIDYKNKRHNEERNLLQNNNQVARASLPARFKLKHSFQKIKAKKYRSLLTNMMLSFSLTGIGLSMILSSSLSSKIKEAFSSIINGNQIVMSLKQDNQNTFSNAYSAPLSKVNEIANKYSYYIEGVGATYLLNFEDFFKDSNEVYVSSTAYKIPLPSLSTRSINDFRWTSDESVMYPYNVSNLNDDQVVLGLTYQDMTNLCFKLQILRNFTSLGQYIKDHDLFLTLHIQNDDWQYEDEQLFEVKAVIETTKSIFYHTNHLWNQEVFEKMMMIPSDDDYEHFFPWEMLKVHYFKTHDDPSVLLDALFYDEEYQDFVFERTNYSYHPNLCQINEVCLEKRILIYLADKNCINPGHLHHLLSEESGIENYYFISDFGYASYGANLLSGFAKNLYVSLDENKVLEAVDADEQLIDENNIEISLPDGVIQGNFMNGISGGLRFSSKIDKLIAGREARNINEIVISKGLVSLLDNENIGIGKYLYIAGENNEFIDEDAKINREYKVEKVVIVGVNDEEDNFLYHNPLWTISFFRDKLGVSSFYLLPKSAIIELDNDVDPNILIQRFEKKYHQYNFTSPINELSGSINSTLEYANVILIAFSVLASLISIMLLGTIVLLNVLESKDEIYLFKVIGIKKKDINSMFLYQSLLQGLIAFVIASIEIVLVDFIISKALGESMHVAIGYSFNFIPILVILAFAIIIPLLTTLFIVRVSEKKR